MDLTGIIRIKQWWFTATHHYIDSLDKRSLIKINKQETHKDPSDRYAFLHSRILIK